LILRLVPEHIPYAGLGPTLAGFSHAIPGIPVSGATNVWNILVDYLYGGKNPMAGIGGSNLATAAEFYLSFGLSGVVVMGFIAGVVFGALFEWQRRQRQNPFLLLLTALVIGNFYGGITSRMPDAIAGIVVSEYLPIVLLAALSLRHKRAGHEILLLAYGVVASYLTFRLFDSWPLEPAAVFARYVTVALLGLLYWQGFNLLNKMPLVSNSRQNHVENLHHTQLVEQYGRPQLVSAQIKRRSDT
jgi:hypothetical protein